jgi:hypothetical protein
MATRRAGRGPLGWTLLNNKSYRCDQDSPITAGKEDTDECIPAT